MEIDGKINWGIFEGQNRLFAHPSSSSICNPNLNHFLCKFVYIYTHMHIHKTYKLTETDESGVWNGLITFFAFSVCTMNMVM